MSPPLAGTAGHGADPRIARAERRLAELGWPDVRVLAAGHEAEVALLRVPDDRWDALAEAADTLVGPLREEGFRYVALDLQPAEPGGGRR